MRILALLVVFCAACATGRSSRSDPTPEFVNPAIRDHGGIVMVPGAVEPPRAGARAVFDITADPDPGAVNEPLTKVARFVNLWSHAGIGPARREFVVVLHGDATRRALGDAAYERHTGSAHPGRALIRELQAAGVELMVCGQALAHRGFDRDEVAPEFQVAVAAATVVIGRQGDGYAYVPFLD